MKTYLASALIVIVSLTFAIGCGLHDRIPKGLLKKHLSEKSKHDILLRDKVPTCNQPILLAAKCVTEFEDELRRDGTIAVKTPDVWGDSNLMHSIQEYDQELHDSLDDFEESIQAYVAQSDRTEGVIELAAALTGAPSVGESGATPPALPENTLINISGAETPFAVLSGLPSAASPVKAGIQLEPTERERQHSTYVTINQALRRRNMAGDNTRKAGYGLYMFRIPVSVLPGEETSQGHAAVANFRAKIVTTKADVRYTLPRMAIADIVELHSKQIHSAWNDPTPDEIAKKKNAATLGSLNRRLAEFAQRYGIRASKNSLALLSDLSSKSGKASQQEFAQEYNFVAMKINEEFKTLLNAAQAVTRLQNRLQVPQPTFDVAMNNDVQLASQVFDIRPDVKIGQLNNALLLDQTKAKIANVADYARTIQVAFTQVPAAAVLDQHSPAPAAVPVVDDVTARSPIQGFDTTGVPVSGLEGDRTIAPLADITSSSDTSDLDYLRQYIQTEYKVRHPEYPNPKLHEIRDFLFERLEQLNIILEEQGAFEYQYGNQAAIQTAARMVELGTKDESIAINWIDQFNAATMNADMGKAWSAWMLAKRCGLVDLNIKRLMREMELRGDLSPQDLADAAAINFFSQDDYQLESARLIWQKIIEKEFPLQVFTLEPLVEEQNLVDSLSRVREMQFALAYSVANGAFNFQQRAKLAQQLALESSAIGVNRTAVGFVHGSDSFGWYFNPRTQSPERKAERRFRPFKQLTSMGPTPAEDRRSYRLEPGVRECEVLIAMPSFVSQVEFDVTTNWERLSKPGRSKRSYEELIREGCRLQEVRQCLAQADCDPGCRPGDLERLHSRVDQLEQMLGMQSCRVRVPFEYMQPATELFDQGNRQLIPSISGHYGLAYLVPESKESGKEFDGIAEFFITGRNFHPTLTHVIVGGHESHSLSSTGDPEVEILSRELIRVRTKIKTDQLAGSDFEVRVGTPGGLSNPLTISKRTAPKVSTPASDFDWKSQPKYAGLFFAPTDQSDVQLVLQTDAAEFEILSNSPVKGRSFADRPNGLSLATAPQMMIIYKTDFKDQTSRDIVGVEFPLNSDGKISSWDLYNQIRSDLRGKLMASDRSDGKITGTCYLRLDNWPLVKFNTSIEISVAPKISAETTTVINTPTASPTTTPSSATPAVTAPSAPPVNSGAGGTPADTNQGSGTR